ncbi:glycoside hydrolase family 48 protein [Clostridium felsineum]|uniref:glycoside hydrolase family 48 protein n=1 Tax=Clostridium felsineum TaxID=36839 RepID=UPI00098C92C6|nr:glycoside hydrolase family 48 protein [Clostridium felsineum]URZ15504.1 Endoglucanase F [Clostridium felsineum DSM 794]
MLKISKNFKKIMAVALTSTVIFGSLSGVLTSKVAAATTDTSLKVNNAYTQRFETMYNKMHDSKNGYFSQDGVPYHSVETFMVEAPDYGHETTSEAFSYYMWLESMQGKLTGNFNGVGTAWDTAEKYIIPSHQDQPGMGRYDASKPATYAPEWEDPSQYPARLDTGAARGQDPISDELKNTYGTSDMYGMHWLMDVDNWYGFGNHADGTSRNSYINTYQRGEQESVFETIPQPCWDAFKYGGRNGYLDLFTGDNSYAKQAKYTDAPDADARAIQATYEAAQAAKQDGVDLSSVIGKASKMGDYLRYAMFDKYFRKIGNSTQAGNGKDSMHYLLSWYYAWGGSQNDDWSWKIGCSHSHFGYQNPFTAWILSTDDSFKPKSATGASDWGKSLTTQVDFYQWLQSSEGAIAGGASNSNHGRYEAWPTGTATFDGMGYQEEPVYHDPGSNTWFGMQAWSMQRMAQYYYNSKDPKAKALLDKWVKWVKSVVKVNADGANTFEVPSTLSWKGQPDTWNGTYTGNPGLHVSVDSYSHDIGTSSSLANTLAYYAAATGDKDSQTLSKTILDDIWANYQDDKGVSAPEVMDSYNRIFNQEVYVPQGWTGTMPNGDVIKSGDKFIDIRSKYKNDPDYARVKADVEAGKSSTFNYHRFWAQSEYAIANAAYGTLFPYVKGDVNDDGAVNGRDLMLLRQYVAGKVDGSKLDLNNADVNGDGVVNGRDIMELTKLIQQQ